MSYKDDKIQELTQKLEEGVKEIFTSGRYEEYLTVMGRFHHYSSTNCILIAIQKPEATFVAGFKAWQNKFERTVNKGETAIRILAPCPYKYNHVVTTTDEAGNEQTVTETMETLKFKIAYVFDVSQTSGQPLPELVTKLEGSFNEYEKLFMALKEAAPVPIRFDTIIGGANGFYDPSRREIVLNSGMSEQQTLKTLIHEIAHSIIHDPTRLMLLDSQPDRSTMEVQAESIAYTVCQYLGLDSSDYSFGYIAGWSTGKDLRELKDNLDLIRKESANIIEQLEPFLKIEAVTNPEKQIRSIHPTALR